MAKHAPIIVKSYLNHVETFGGARETNSQVAALLFRISPDQKTIVTALTESIHYFNHTDPLPYVSFAYECAVAAANAKIAMNPNDLITILYNVAPICLSNVRVTRSLAFHLVMAIFGISAKNLNDLQNQDSKDTQNSKDSQNSNAQNIKDPLNEIDLELSSEALQSATVSLFARSILTQNEEFAKALVDLIVKNSNKAISLPNAMILRAAIGIHGLNLFKTSMSTFQFIIEHAYSRDSNDKVRYHLTTAITAFASTNMISAISLVLLTDQIEVRRYVVSMIIMSEARRDLFLKEYFKLLIENGTISLFRFLLTVIEYYSVEDNIGTFISCIILWLSSLNSQIKNISSKEVKESRNEIFQCLQKLFQHTIVGKISEKNFNIEFNNFEQLEKTLYNISVLISNLECDTVFKICAKVGELLISKSDADKVCSTIIFISLFSIFSKCTNLQSKQITAKLSECLNIGFKSSNNESRKYLVISFSNRISYSEIESLHRDHATQIFLSILESLFEEKTKTIGNKEAVTVLTYLNTKIDTKSVKFDLFLNSLRILVDNVSFSVEILELIERYISMKSDISEFLTFGKFNLVYFVELLSNERSDVRTRSSQIIKKLTTGLTEQSLRNMMKAKDLINLTNEVVKKTKALTVTNEVIDFIFKVIESVIDENVQENNTLRDAAMALAIECYGSTSVSESAEKLLRLLMP
ncbi:hypothetical protein TVAG_060290 [Trichomonas vaginalis G3]|uniref:Uncharacterized protein n=1 Tax=Trichomonas vaginalis (strain ATCC PRA-98 / G3) TaxID=412133 RepID=A2ECF8_TRIV3|nr:armadillo (ARM) repeat-containing protein family [Trichomonas vaginalis G3]EAY09653.1 hypothetical protein TVAG_060290 [Trichomonas vaginalis G3]KAI5528655.1 armadillo (ARM) repeat-containing protein family [Trichomonas vaginalis G3]|eukprot:XP_001321876.1 hypothetical protein [Trichomonas vaginalis G3]